MISGASSASPRRRTATVPASTPPSPPRGSRRCARASARSDLKRAAAVLILAAATTAVHAGRPLTTEDASVLEDKACQLESWIDRSREATQGWAVPACNFGAGIEWQAGFARSWGDSRSFLSSAYVQAKTVLREPQPGSFGVGVVAGLTRTPTRSTH